MSIRRKIYIAVGMIQGIIGALASVLAYIVYYNLFNVQAVLNLPSEDAIFYMMLLIVFGLLSIISGLFLVNGQ